MAKDRIILERQFVPKGTVIIKQGEEAYSAYLIQSGRVSVFSNHNGKEIELAQLGIGEICGEMALMSRNPRSANVRAIEDCTLIVITALSFEEKLRKSDVTVQAVVRMMINRIVSSNDEVVDKTLSSQDLGQSLHNAYNSALGALDPQKAKKFSKVVKPKLDDLISAITDILK